MRRTTELDRLILDAGGTFLGYGRHKYYMLDGVRITIHMGSKVCQQQVSQVRATIRRILKRRAATEAPVRDHDEVA